MQAIKNKDGQLVVWLILTFPVIIVIFAFFVNTIVVIDAKMRLQAAVDRGAYAGAAVLAHMMNEVAARNWLFRKAYLDKQSHFDKASNENKDWIENQVKELANIQDSLYAEMSKLLADGYVKAHDMAKRVAERNLEEMPHLVFARYVSLYGDEGELVFQMTDDFNVSDGYKNKVRVRPAGIEGVVFDPNDKKSYEYTVRKYLKKDDSYYAAIASGIEAWIRPPLLPDFFTQSGAVRFRVAAAGQPFGGSIKDFAHTSAEDLNDALSAGKDLLYHPAIVPLKAVRGDINVED